MASLEKSIYSKNQAALQDLLRQVRKQAKLRQEDVATNLGKPQSFVSKYESGERRLDILELREVCAAMGTSLVEFARRLERALSKVD
jgi:transcriptional regulator with XRE-family HTH domain